MLLIPEWDAALNDNWGQHVHKVGAFVKYMQHVEHKNGVKMRHAGNWDAIAKEVKYTENDIAIIELSNNIEKNRKTVYVALHFITHNVEFFQSCITLISI